MNKTIVAVATLTILSALSTIAHAKKTRVCENWLPYATTRTDVKDAAKFLVCFDSKTPRIMKDVKFVEVKDDEGNVRRIAVELGE